MHKVSCCVRGTEMCVKVRNGTGGSKKARNLLLSAEDLLQYVDCCVTFELTVVCSKRLPLPVATFGVILSLFQYFFSTSVTL